MPAAPIRNTAVDFYRIAGVVAIVLGHWLAGSVTYRDGRFGRQNPLADLPWTQWLTWVFQAVPIFFLVAGYAAALSWRHHCGDAHLSRQNWVRRRLARVLGPTVVYVALVSACVMTARAAGVSASLLDYAGWAVAMHLWFLAVYSVVVSLTPWAMAASRRWGAAAPLVFAVGVAAVDAVALAGHVPGIGWLNYLLCWAALFQLGIAWQEGLLGGFRPVLLAMISAGSLWLLIGPGPYPVSMIGVPGQAVQNTEPPSAAMLAFAGVQAGLLIAAAPAVNRMLRGRTTRRLVSRANDHVMALYLWHMIPVVLVAVVAYPAGLLPQPVEGSGGWWLSRLEWVAILAAVTAAELALLWWARRVAVAPVPGVDAPNTRWIAPMTALGALLSSYGLAGLAAAGFAPSGHLNGISLLAIAVGAALVTLRRRDSTPTEP